MPKSLLPLSVGIGVMSKHSFPHFGSVLRTLDLTGILNINLKFDEKDVIPHLTDIINKIMV